MDKGSSSSTSSPALVIVCLEMLIIKDKFLKYMKPPSLHPNLNRYPGRHKGQFIRAGNTPRLVVWPQLPFHSGCSAVLGSQGPKRRERSCVYSTHYPRTKRWDCSGIAFVTPSGCMRPTWQSPQEIVIKGKEYR